MRYTVRYTFTKVCEAEIEIEAANEEEAEKIAREFNNVEEAETEAFAGDDFSQEMEIKIEEEDE